MPGEVEYFGIRHHGPGSAQRLVESLDRVRPAEVLIEGPADLSELIPMLADKDMVPPVALLAYPAGEPERSVFWPFSVFSPEYQAILWAAKHDVPARFIDLPVYWRLRDSVPAAEPEAAAENFDASDEHKPGSDDVPESPLATIQWDPIGALAFAAGYVDGESWWQDVIEENPQPGPIFAAVADAMRALREDVPPPKEDEAAREAHMRLEIAKSRKRDEGTIAVVCGAWHVPALTEKHTAKDDRALLKGVPKRKVSATWTPWTAPRLALSSGYGAGVRAPGWNRHLWETPRNEQATRWIARIARCLREQGQVVSTASLIETERLAVSLAAIRGRPQAGFEELTDATVACMCFGNHQLWQSIAADVLIGSEVGRIPDGVPLAPLLEDLQRQQKTARLKPEALERELSLDLRSDSGLFRSTLLHRLAALDVPWGKLDDPGRSRGTFRERWVLRWEPEYSVSLVENLVYGATIAQAASGRIIAGLRKSNRLGDLSNLVFEALTAQLPDAAAEVSAALEHRAGQATDCLEMLSALPPIADVLRYGKARHVDTGQMNSLFDRIAGQASIALHYAARGLDEEAAGLLRNSIAAADRSIQLIESPALPQWIDSLGEVIHDDQATALVAGQAARLLYESEHLGSEDAVSLLSRKLSPGTTIADAAGFFEGFLEGAGNRLIHDADLRHCVSDWIMSLDEETFVESLPLFRRVFSNMDKMERRRLLDAALGRQTTQTGYQVIEAVDPLWSDHLRRVTEILSGGGSDG
ncbi:DUF5682 family protein [Rhodopirellula sp. JC639]|uniref:DUF5682 family protein n=1 Tax=Stieleria mannarensis TaxID=2755585 RepID=UPI0016037259|nr:DUF5682 family protein [Rhodopirellula sp. JC639]